MNLFLFGIGIGLVISFIAYKVLTNKADCDLIVSNDINDNPLSFRFYLTLDAISKRNILICRVVRK